MALGMGSVSGAASVEALEADIKSGRVILARVVSLFWVERNMARLGEGRCIQWNRSIRCSPRDRQSLELLASTGLGRSAGQCRLWVEGEPTCRPNMGTGHGEQDVGSWSSRSSGPVLKINRKKRTALESGDEELGDVWLFELPSCLGRLEPTKGEPQAGVGQGQPRGCRWGRGTVGPCSHH